MWHMEMYTLAFLNDFLLLSTSCSWNAVSVKRGIYGLYNKTYPFIGNLEKEYIWFI